MVGNGELDVALRDKYRNIPGIHFIDFQNQRLMPAIYELADVFVLPSIGPGETWGLAVNEAMANGKAVIVSDKCGCAADLVMNGINGYIFRAGDLNDLTKVLKRMNEHRDSIEAMKKESKIIIGGFTIEKVAETIERVVNK
jgi:glycosyltransferase involved in cell wall biosynthesis